MSGLLQLLAIGLGGSVGSMLRYLVAVASGRLFGTAFPVGTFLINITGSLFLGWFMTMIRERMLVSDTTRLAIAVGFVGAYTTFSTFVFESSALLDDGSDVKATANMLGSLIFGLIAVRAGAWLATHG